MQKDQSSQEKQKAQKPRKSIWKRIGRILKWLLLSFTLFCFLILFWFLFGGAVCNDIRAARLKRAYQKLELPPETTRVELTSFVGNTSGTGNHTEIWVGMLLFVESPERLFEAEASETYLYLEEFFHGYEVDAVPEDLTAAYPYPKDFMEFQALQGEESGKGYFVIGNYYDAVTQVDLRGH